MKSLIVITLLLCVSPLLVPGESAAPLHLQIKIVRGERSKDSHSETTEITINGQTLAYRKTYSGRPSGRAPVQKEFELKTEDQSNLIKLIKERNLLRTESIEREQDVSGMYLYFELSIKATVNESTGSVYLKGSRKTTALKEEKLYQDAVALIEEIYAIINRTDRAIAYEPLIR